jgi:hypothetical protein
MLRVIKKSMLLTLMLWSLVLSGCADMSNQQQDQVTSAGVDSGKSFYQQQGETFGKTLSNQLGTAFGDMP